MQLATPGTTAFAPLAPSTLPAPDPAGSALARAVAHRDRRGTDIDGALALFVRRAHVHEETIERMLARLGRLLLAHVRPLREDDDPREVIALLMRRAITAYYRPD
jgi:hypothetical protein